MYEQFEKQMPLLKYEPTAEQITRAKELLRADKVKELGRNPTSAELAQLNKSVDDEIDYFLRKKTVDEVDVEQLKNQAGDVL